MAKTMEELRKEAEIKRIEEKNKLLAMSEHEAESLPVSDRYQRIRYLREKEAAIWLEDLRRGLPTQKVEDSPIRPRKSFNSFVSVREKWKD